jgi:hypothetical protein
VGRTSTGDEFDHHDSWSHDLLQQGQLTFMAATVSVITAAHNAAKYLPAALQSVLSQNYQDFELIIVDDGSTDETPYILKRFALRDPRIRYVRQQKSGASHARNTALALATGQFVAVMDSDDICYPQRLELQVAYLQEHKECVCLGAAVEFIDEWGAAFYTESRPVDHDAIVQRLLRGEGGVIRQPVVTMRREAIMEVGGYEQRFPVVEDLDLFLRLSEVGRVANLPEVLLGYRQHAKSTNRTQYKLQQQQQLQVVMEARQRRGLPSVPSQSLDLMSLHPPDVALIELELAHYFLQRGRRAAAMRHAIQRARLGGIDWEALRLLCSCLVGRRVRRGVQHLRKLLQRKQVPDHLRKIKQQTLRAFQRLSSSC